MREALAELRKSGGKIDGDSPRRLGDFLFGDPRHDEELPLRNKHT
jgi:hypothetical protein